MGRWRDSWAARNPSVRLASPTRQTRLTLWFRAIDSSALMGVLPDTAAASAGSAGCSFTKGSLWRSLRPETFQKRHESLKQRRCAANELAETPRRHGDLSHPVCLQPRLEILGCLSSARRTPEITRRLVRF